NGVDVAGISASMASGTANLSISNSGALHVDRIAGNTTNAGIYANNAGTGNITVINSGLIDPPAYGMFVTGAGNVAVGNSGNVTPDTGIHADTTGTTTSVMVQNSGPISALNGNGIEAYGNATSGTVAVINAGNITANAGTGIDATDKNGNITIINGANVA